MKTLKFLVLTVLALCMTIAVGVDVQGIAAAVAVAAVLAIAMGVMFRAEHLVGTGLAVAVLCLGIWAAVPGITRAVGGVSLHLDQLPGGAGLVAAGVALLAALWLTSHASHHSIGARGTRLLRPTARHRASVRRPEPALPERYDFSDDIDSDDELGLLDRRP